MKRFTFLSLFLIGLLIGLFFPGVSARAQTTALTDYTGLFAGTTGLHPCGIAFPARPFFNGVASYRISRSFAATRTDTLYCPGADSTCSITMTRETKPARTPGVINNQPWFGWATGTVSPNGAKRDYITMTYMIADTLTFTITIKKYNR